MGPEVVAERRRKAQAHLEFVLQLYRSQLERGAHFLREHPATASSWGEQCAQDLLGMPGVRHGVGHMCRFGVRATST
eukprot:14001388-Alexandrium_andersonii.AAC.1